MFKKAAVLLALTGVVLACSWALFHPEFLRIHDYLHAVRIAELLRALQEGHFPVRWSKNFDYGYGMPLFEFYGPLPFYVGAVFYWLGLDLVTTLKALWLLCSVGTAVGAYLLGKELFGRAGGLVTAATIAVAPYRAVNLFVRGSLGEVWGMMAMPWILWGIVRTVRGQRHGSTIMIAGLVTLFLSHNLMTLLFVPITLLFLVAVLFIENRTVPAKMRWQAVIKTGLILARNYLISTALTAFYLFPAFLEKDFTKVKVIVSGYFDYALHFLYIRQFITPYWGYGGSTWGPQDGISFFLGWGQLFGLAVTAALLAVICFFKVTHRQPLNVLQQFSVRKLLWAVLAFALTGVSLFMTLEKSHFMWRAAQFLSFVQFPWRWIGVAVMFIGLACGLGVTLLKNKTHRIIYALILTAITIATTTSYFRPEGYLGNADAWYYDDEKRIQVEMSPVLEDYVPIQMPDGKQTPPETMFSIQPSPSIPSEILIDHGHEKLLTVMSDKPAVVTFNVADFPGWYAEVDGQRVEKVTSDKGLVSVPLQGSNRGQLVGIKFGSTPIRAASDVISLVAVIGVLAYTVTLSTLKLQSSRYD